jgi:hypothetical protein
MVEKSNEHLNKQDLELILEVNKKAIEIQTEVIGQNEDVINVLSGITKTLEGHIISDDKIQEAIDKKLEKLVEQFESINKDLFKIQVLFITGILALVAQVIQIFLRK